MAARDIMPWIDTHGGVATVRWGQMTASEFFDIGEPVAVVAAGTLTEPPDDATEFILADAADGFELGIAAWGPAGGAQTNDAAAHINPATGMAYTTGDDLPYWPADEGTLFITQNLFAAGAGSAVTPAQTDIGNAYQMSYATFGTPDTGWGLEQTAAGSGTDVMCVVTEVLDAQKAPIRITGNTGVYVVFKMRTV